MAAWQPGLSKMMVSRLTQPGEPAQASHWAEPGLSQADLGQYERLLICLAQLRIGMPATGLMELGAGYPASP